MTIRQIRSGKSVGSDNIPAEAHKSDIEECLGGRTSADGLDSRTPHQDAKERRSEKMRELKNRNTIDTGKGFQQSVSELYERFSRRPTSRSTDRIP
ncbi:unnamed protein product [Schistosoma curassoni]|uniref:Uncharacterized protein n=1 Tax=Schistosoma curassoni TaxID=6186 RepID=A0A183KDE2_9TREM|nr:unnamed protein product [Schistosoma curassoni]